MLSKINKLLLFLFFILYCFDINARDYFTNIIGYVQIKIPTGFSMISNPLDDGENEIGVLFSKEKINVEDGIIIYKYDSESLQYSINSFDFGMWSDPYQKLNPGEGAFILNINDPIDLLFTGEVRHGILSQIIPIGFSIQSSQVPQVGRLSFDLNFPIQEEDVIYQYNNELNQYIIYTYNFGEWLDEEPVIEIGESFFVNKIQEIKWERDFIIK